MKIGLFFGSFNPIHVGHLIIASFVTNNTDLDQTWLVVSPQNPQKPKSVLLNEFQRLHLVKLAIENDNQLKAIDVEFRLPRPSYTINTLTYLQEKHVQHEFFVVLGSDSFKNLPKWKNYEKLVREYSFIIYNRPGYEVTKKLNAKFKNLKVPFLDISATLIRKNVAEGKSIKYLVPEAVRLEIENSSYYKTKTSIKNPS